MAKGILRRRELKAAKRKKLLAERQKAGAPAPTSVTGQVRRAAVAPIYRCLIQEELFERGNGVIFLARGTAHDGFVAAGFLLDTYCLGVKDVFCHPGLDTEEVDTIIADIDEATPVIPAEPGYARNLPPTIRRPCAALSRDCSLRVSTATRPSTPLRIACSWKSSPAPAPTATSRTKRMRRRSVP